MPKGSISTTENLGNWLAAAVCFTVALAPNHVIKRHLKGALRLLGLVATDTSANKTKQATRSIVQLVPPPLSSAAAAAATATASSGKSSAMGNHSYDYDLIVIGGGSGGLVR